MDGACNASSFNGWQWLHEWHIVAFLRRAIIIKPDACGGYHAITAYTLYVFLFFYGFSRYNPLPRFRVCLLKSRPAWRVCCQQRKYFRVHARCQYRAAVRFCEKSSSFPPGERIFFGKSAAPRYRMQTSVLSVCAIFPSKILSGLTPDFQSY